MEFVS